MPEITGTEGDDTIHGTSDADSIRGLGGNDRLFGEDGDDGLRGGSGRGMYDDDGNDELHGGAGNDELLAAGGVDSLYGDGGNDIISAGGPVSWAFAQHSLFGGDGDDFISIFSGALLVDGGSGTDTLFIGGNLSEALTIDLTNLWSGGSGVINNGTISSIEIIHSIVGTGYNDVIDAGAGATQNLSIEGGGGDDTIYGGGQADGIWGGLGNDEIFGRAGNDTLRGEGGDDILDGGSGNDSLDGGAGTDTVRFSGTLSDYTVSTASGVTTVTGSHGSATLTNIEILQFADGSFNPNTLFTGTSADDVINGGTDDDRINGLGGNDFIHGNGGADTIDGGDGDDVLRGGYSNNSNPPAGQADGADILTGGAGADVLRGQDGNDQLFGGSDDDNLRGDLGDDLLDGGDGFDMAGYRFDDIGAVAGVNFDASLIGTAASIAFADGRGGTDTLVSIEGVIVVGTTFNDTFTGSSGRDQITTVAGSDVVNAGGGNDVIIDYNGSSTLNGGDGDDRYDMVAGGYYGGAGSGSDTLDGGAGDDTVVFYWAGVSSNITINLSAGNLTASTANAALAVTGTSIEQLAVFGGSGNDSLTGGDADDVLIGGAGVDVLNGGDGDDELEGGAGDDTLNGGAGLDRYRLSVSNAFLAGVVDASGFNVSGGTTTVSDGQGGTDTISGIEGVAIVGGNFNDTLIGSAGGDTLNGGYGGDTINGGGGDDLIIQSTLGTNYPSQPGVGQVLVTETADAINGGDGFDTVSYEGVSSDMVVDLGLGTVSNDSTGNDTLASIEGLITGSGADLVTGSDAANRLESGAGDDVVRGGLGDDVLLGGSGNDILNGGAGNDLLNGGDGIDTADYANAGAGVTASLAIIGRGQDTRGAGRDTLSGIENLSGSSFGDTLTGDAGDNVLGDTLGGNDRFIGGAGNDTLSVERSGNGAATTLALTGGIGDDTMTFDGHGRYTDSVTFEGQDGNDVISAVGAFKANVNGGSGNDTVTVDTLGGSFVVKLGSGSDTLILADTDGGFGGSAANLVRDFVAGAGGDIIDLTAYLAGGALTNYTPGDNPFLDGHMRLVQAGADTLVQIDRDGGSDGFVTVMTLQKTFASNFTAFNFNGLAPLPAPVEGGSGVDSLTGTESIDVLNGNGGNDSLVGLAGADVLNGGAGNDVLDGGDGDDVLNGGSGGLGDTATYATASAGVLVNLGVLGLQNTGGSGFDSLTGIEHLVGSSFTDELRGDGFANQLTDTLGGDDFLRGEAGNDTLLITRSGGGAATTVRLNGGADDDALTFTGNGRFSDTVTLEGEAGNDVITVSGALTIGIDAGAGDDTVIYDTLGGVHRMTLGTGVDTVRLAGTGGLFQASGDNLVRDFTTGAGGDIVDLSAYIAGGALTNYTGGSNPFGDGHMRLIQSGSRTLLQVDRDGGGDGYQTVLAFAGTTVAAFTTANFNGIDPTGTAPMPVQAGDKDADAGPQVWVQESGDKDLMPEVLPGAGDEARDVFADVGPAPGVSGGGSDPWIPLTLDEAGDGFLTVSGGLNDEEAEPLVVPGEQTDDLPELADPFTWTQADGAGPSTLTVGEDGLLLAGSGPGDHGRDGWLF